MRLLRLQRTPVGPGQLFKSVFRCLVWSEVRHLKTSRQVESRAAKLSIRTSTTKWANRTMEVRQPTTEWAWWRLGEEAKVTWLEIVFESVITAQARTVLKPHKLVALITNMVSLPMWTALTTQPWLITTNSERQWPIKQQIRLHARATKSWSTKPLKRWTLRTCLRVSRKLALRLTRPFRPKPLLQWKLKGAITVSNMPAMIQVWSISRFRFSKRLQPAFLEEPKTRLRTKKTVAKRILIATFTVKQSITPLITRCTRPKLSKRTG